MKKGIFGVAIAVIISFLAVLVFFDFGQPEFKKADRIYHVTLASPDLYKEGVFVDSFLIQKGEYLFRFVPNGDSPEILSITLTGSSFSFSEDFGLEGSSHETGISVYYTWDYIGEKQLSIPDEQELEILINPHGNIQGPVSLDIIKM
ncbi:MAG: hypothetical protein FJ356_00010 [Thaumarchaeota archaeon]|nr:hypothetical protein [Nitrososphaerota archaeon]